MTYREKLQQEHPRMACRGFDGGCFLCPDNYGYEEYSECEEVDGNCERCWDREIQEEVDEND